MPARALTATTGTADVGDTWRCLVLVTGNTDTTSVPDTITGTVTLPAGSNPATATATVTRESTGIYTVTYTLAAAGQHYLTVTVASTTFGNDVLVFEVLAVTGAGTVPDLAAVKTYLGDHSHTDAEISDALAAETQAQRDMCRRPVPYPTPMAQALMRRVARNLALRRMPLAMTQGDADFGPLAIPGRDPEVRRLEAPYRRLVVG